MKGKTGRIQRVTGSIIHKQESSLKGNVMAWGILLLLGFLLMQPSYVIAKGDPDADDFYERLDVDPTASKAEIEKTFEQRVREVNANKTLTKPAKAAILRRYTQAWNELTGSRRQEYDTDRAQLLRRESQQESQDSPYRDTPSSPNEDSPQTSRVSDGPRSLDLSRKGNQHDRIQIFLELYPFQTAHQRTQLLDRMRAKDLAIILTQAESIDVFEGAFYGLKRKVNLHDFLAILYKSIPQLNQLNPPPSLRRALYVSLIKQVRSDVDAEKTLGQLRNKLIDNFIHTPTDYFETYGHGLEYYTVYRFNELARSFDLFFDTQPSIEEAVRYYNKVWELYQLHARQERTVGQHDPMPPEVIAHFDRKWRKRLLSDGIIDTQDAFVRLLLFEGGGTAEELAPFVRDYSKRFELYALDDPDRSTLYNRLIDLASQDSSSNSAKTLVNTMLSKGIIRNATDFAVLIQAKAIPDETSRANIFLKHRGRFDMTTLTPAEQQSLLAQLRKTAAANASTPQGPLLAQALLGDNTTKDALTPIERWTLTRLGNHHPAAYKGLSCLRSFWSITRPEK